MSYEYGDQKWVGRKKVVEAIEASEDLLNELMVKVTKARVEKAYKTTPAPIKKVDDSSSEDDEEEE
jgi:hypothetical protein